LLIIEVVIVMVGIRGKGWW